MSSRDITELETKMWKFRVADKVTCRTHEGIKEEEALVTFYNYSPHIFVVIGTNAVAP